jgi:hypothetical protein
MRKKRRAFLFGAGAALEWGAPKTSELTDLILNSGFKITDNRKRVTQFIYETLLDNGYKNVNFETVISVIEELVVYYSNFDLANDIPSIYSCFFDPKFKQELLNFSIEGENRTHGYVLQIPKGVKYDFAKNSLQNETPEQFYFEHLLGELLTDISSRIIEYSYYSENHSKIDLENYSSRSFIDWMELHSKQTPLRLYTLNYDKLFKVLLEQNKIEVFEGFDLKNNEDVHKGIRPNVLGILSNFEGNVHYNLHGSCYWDVEELDFHQLANPEVFYRHFPNLPGNNTPASLQIEKGRTLMVTNIITGYQKAQKSMITPFKQMQSAFDKDCCLADEIYVIGYSFGDEHINSSLRTAIRHNRNLKIIIVDPFFMKNNLDVEVSMKLFSAKDGASPIPKKIDNNIHAHFDETFIVYSMTFEEFRERQLSAYNKAAGGIHYY